MGLSFSQQGKFEQAILAFDNLIKINPNFHEAYLNKAIALKSMNLNEEAKVCFNKAVALNSIDHETNFDRNNILSLVEKTEAIVCYNDETPIELSETGVSLRNNMFILLKDFKNCFFCYVNKILLRFSFFS